MHSDYVTLSLALLAGMALAAASGLRAFLPLLAVGVGARFFHVQLQPALQWLTGDIPLVALGSATAIEILGDKIPAIDHALDVAATFIRPVTAALATYGILVHWPSPWAQIIAVLLGGSALAIHAAKANTRVGSSIFTLGLANPLLSVVEDVMSFTFIAIAFLAPVIIALLMLLVFLWMTGRRRRTSAKPS